jgi:hypothetical protein
VFPQGKGKTKFNFETAKELVGICLREDYSEQAHKEREGFEEDDDLRIGVDQELQQVRAPFVVAPI